MALKAKNRKEPVGVGELFARSLFMGQIPQAFRQSPMKTIEERGRQVAAFAEPMFTPSLEVPQGNLMDKAMWAAGTPGVMPMGSISKKMRGFIRRLPRAQGQVGGLNVGERISNMSSLGASGINETAPGVRAFPMQYLQTDPRKLFYAADDIRRVDALAEQIRQSGRIDPIIVAFDKEGPYILEGAHRVGALHRLGIKEIPALIGIE